MKKFIFGLVAGVALGFAGFQFYGHNLNGRSPASDYGSKDNDDGGQQCKPLVTMLSNPPVDPLHCTFHANGFADSTIDYDPVAATVTTTTGSPAAQQTFTNVTVATGLQPYLNNGLTFIAFGDVPLFEVMLTALDGNFQSTWDGAPGGPARILNAGICTIPGNGSCDDDCDEHHHRRHHKMHQHDDDHDHGHR